MSRVCSVPGCPELVQAGLCADHARKRERARGSRQARGYDAAHVSARNALSAMILEQGSVRCGYGCGTAVTVDTFVAAHVVDGRPELGWLASCRSCNERAKAGASSAGAGRRLPEPPADSTGSWPIFALYGLAESGRAGS